MHEAFANWPEKHAFKPRDTKHLYGWLLIEAGHCETTDIDLSHVPPGTPPKTIAAIVAAMARAMMVNKAARLHCIRGGLTETPNTDGELVTVFRVSVPLSLNKEHAPKRKFEEVSRDVFDIVEQITGVDIEKMKAEAKRGHA